MPESAAEEKHTPRSDQGPGPSGRRRNPRQQPQDSGWRILRLHSGLIILLVNRKNKIGNSVKWKTQYKK